MRSEITGRKPNLIICLKLVHNAGEEERELGGVEGAVGKWSKVKEVISAAFTWEHQQVTPTLRYTACTARGHGVGSGT